MIVTQVNHHVRARHAEQICHLLADLVRERVEQFADIQSDDGKLGMQNLPARAP